MKRLLRNLLLAVLAVFIFAAGAAEPVLAKKSKSYCQDYARRQANRYANPANIVGGAALGAGAGAITGGIINGGKGAGVGAIIGGLGGAAVSGITTDQRWRRVYDRAYADCRSWK